MLFFWEIMSCKILKGKWYCGALFIKFLWRVFPARRKVFRAKFPVTRAKYTYMLAHPATTAIINSACPLVFCVPQWFVRCDSLYSLRPYVYLVIALICNALKTSVTAVLTNGFFIVLHPKKRPDKLCHYMYNGCVEVQQVLHINLFSFKWCAIVVNFGKVLLMIKGHTANFTVVVLFSSKLSI